jgi:peptidylprolyl isomerase
VKKNSIRVAELAAVAIIFLAGCGTSSEAESTSLPTDSATGSSADLELLNSITWSTDDAGVPTLVFDVPISVSEGASRVVQEGDGAVVAEGDLVTFDYSIASGVDGSVIASSYTDDQGGESLLLIETSLNPVFYAAFVGRKVGAQIMYATITTDPSGLTTDMVPIVGALTLTGASTPLERATGLAVPTVDGLPVVTLADSGEPTVSNPATDPPAELIAQSLIEGEGEGVNEGDVLVVHYSGWLWDGTAFDSSWSTGAAATLVIGDGEVIAGWVDGLVGKSIGSQVLLVIPPSLGYGDEASESIPAGSTLVFVVDILAAS